MSFSFDETVSLSLHLVSPRHCSDWLFQQGLLSCFTSTWVFFQFLVLPSPPRPGKGETFPPCIWPPVLSRGNTISSLIVLEYEVPSQTVCCAHLVGYQTCLVEKGSATGQHRQATDREVLCPLVFGSPGLPRCLQQLSALWGSLHCVIAGEVEDNLRWSEICAGRWQLEVLCLHVLWWVQVLPVAFRSLPFSVLCVVFQLYWPRLGIKRERPRAGMLRTLKS
jgi:hypothetical protein